jgi:hypothetical protein
LHSEASLVSQYTCFSQKTTDLKELCILIIREVQGEEFLVLKEPLDCENLKKARFFLKKSIK